MKSFKADFVDCVEFGIPNKDVTKVNKVIVICTTTQTFKNRNGDGFYLPWMPYHLPMSYIWLFSTKTYNQIHGGNSSVYADRVKINSIKNKLVIPTYGKVSNLTIVFDSVMTHNDKK